MMFGHVETLEERVEHLRRLRELQDETAGFTAFISWTFQAPNTEMPDVPMAGGFDYLRTAAVSRLYLDNVESFQSSFVTQGIDVAGVALRYGMNDLGSVMIEENVVSAANCECLATIELLEEQIRAAGFTPARRNMFYDRVDATGHVLRRHHDAAWAAKNARRRRRRAARGDRAAVRGAGRPASLSGARAATASSRARPSWPRSRPPRRTGTRTAPRSGSPRARPSASCRQAAACPRRWWATGPRAPGASAPSCRP
jgi:hypothetical protein